MRLLRNYAPSNTSSHAFKWALAAFFTGFISGTVFNTQFESGLPPSTGQTTPHTRPKGVTLRMNHILGLPAEIADAILATTLSYVSHPRGHYRQLETLRLVCRLWDITILNTAAFWSIIHLDQPIDMTTRCLERSRGYPLDIYGSNWSAYLDLIEPMPEPLAEELLHHAHRIRLLDVCIDRDHPRLGHLLTNPMPALESLTVKRHPYSRASSAINLQSSVRLHSLRLHCIDLDPRALDAVHGLRHLALSVPSSFQDTLDIVSRYPQLQILEIQSPLHAHAGDILQQETIHLPLLDALDLTNLSTNDAFQIINKFVVRRGCRINVTMDVQRSRPASAAAGWAQLVASAFATTSNNSLVVMKMTESTLQLRLGPVEVKLTSLVAPEAEGKQIFRALEAALSGREILLHLSQFPVWCPAPRTFPGIIGQLSLDVRGLIIEGEEGVRDATAFPIASLVETG
ncbi:hypothetical protein FRB97_005759 [Tulasnella sp. 331]|nr:hypothetical protein FRB97_005759 [Tulasnella sp. 331]